MSFRRSLCLTYAVTLLACGRSETDSLTKSTEAADRIYADLTKNLNSEFAEERGRIWSPTMLELAEDWIIQSPEGLWGASPESLPPSVDCSSTNRRCHPTFKRLSCESNADCSTVGTSCEPLEAAISELGASSEKYCLARADQILNRLHRTMTAAEHELDIVSLSLPTGQFRETMINALSVLSQKSEIPKVRFLFSGGPKPVVPNIVSPADKALKAILKEVVAKSPRAASYRMDFAYLNFPTKLSWNHAKIIVADGELAITGGHNLWDDAYLSARPLFDLSMEYRGEAAAASRDFVNTLWDLPHNGEAHYPDSEARLPLFSEMPQTKGETKAVSIGRLGSLGANPSEFALRTLVNIAKESIRIDQQDLYNQVISSLTRSFIEDELIQAALRGVKIQIVQSNNYPLIGGYGSVDGDKVYKVLIKRLVDALRDRGFAVSQAQALACTSIEYAPFRFSRHMDKWDSGWTSNTIGTHTKLLIVDDAAFYIGSHNLYPANLQEFGLIVTDAKATLKLKADYWDKVWAESSTAKFPCPKII